MSVRYWLVELEGSCLPRGNLAHLEGLGPLDLGGCEVANELPGGAVEAACIVEGFAGITAAGLMPGVCLPALHLEVLHTRRVQLVLRHLRKWSWLAVQAQCL